MIVIVWLRDDIPPCLLKSSIDLYLAFCLRNSKLLFSLKGLDIVKVGSIGSIGDDFTGCFQ